MSGSSTVRAGRAVVLLTATLALVASAVPASASHIAASALASAMARNAGDVSSASYTATPNGEPQEVLSTSVGGFPRNGASFAALTTGDAGAITSPNNSARTGTEATGSDIRGALDVTILRVDLSVPSGVNCLSLDFRFYSEEFPEFVGSGLANDGFVAELDGSTWSLSGATLNAPNNFAVDENDSVITIDGVGNNVTDGNAAGTTYDRATGLLTAKTSVTMGPHSLYLSIYDHGDPYGDSAVFVDDLRLTSEAAGTCEGPGGGTGSADLSITKTDSPDPVAVGATLTYTLTVTNDGPDPASGIAVSDTLPGSMTFGSATPSQGTCTGTSTVNCSLGSLAFGAIATVTIQVTPTTPGNPSNTASVSSSAADPDGTNNSGTASTTVTAQAFTLTVSMGGSGGGNVSSSPGGIACPGDCSESYADGTLVALSATPAVGSVFAGWSGACTGTGACNVTMDAAKSVTATFNLQTYALTVSIAPTSTGTGSVTSSVPGVDCPGDCSENYPSGTSVVLTASPAAGSFFGGWSGACIGTGTCNLTMNANRSVTASFFLEGQTFSLSASVAGGGSGTVASSPPGISCPGDCSEVYTGGTVVALTATPATGSVFGGWSGACSGSGACSVTMDAAKSVTATFNTGGGTSTNSEVTLKASKKKVPRGKKVKLTATVTPCGAVAGDMVELKAGKKVVTQKATDGNCSAVFPFKMRKKTVFQAVSRPDGQPARMSNKVKVRIKSA